MGEASAHGGLQPGEQACQVLPGTCKDLNLEVQYCLCVMIHKTWQTVSGCRTVALLRQYVCTMQHYMATPCGAAFLVFQQQLSM